MERTSRPEVDEFGGPSAWSCNNISKTRVYKIPPPLKFVELHKMDRVIAGFICFMLLLGCGGEDIG